MLRVGDDETCLIINFHHIAADTESIAIVLSEVATFYEAGPAGATRALETPSATYLDYVAWMESPACLARAEAQLDYWRGELDGAQASLEFAWARKPAGRGSDA